MREPCQECDAQGWVVGTQTQPECCGRCEFECGGAGCTGPVPVQVQTQELCPRCGGSGEIKTYIPRADANTTTVIPMEKTG